MLRGITVQPRFLLYCVFACSGAAALTYEITWTRLLGLLLGHTTAAASTVLAAFMGGLALGAIVAGRLAPRLTRPFALRTYAALEIGVALLALALPFELAAAMPLLRAVYADGDGGLVFALVRALCAFVTVLLPATALGATLPLAIRWLDTTADAAGRETGWLYAANTIGATAGAVLAGFVLLPALGSRQTTLVAVALNVVAAVVAIWLSRPAAPLPVVEHASRLLSTMLQSGRMTTDWVALRRTAIAAAALSGAASLILQIAWARILALAIGPTTYAFSAMVATFIAGIAIGSAIAAALTRRRAAAGLLSFALLGGVVVSLLAAAWVPSLPLIAADVVAQAGEFETVMRAQIGLIVAVMLPMTIAAGAALPLAAGLAARRDDSVPRDVAAVYAANTAGAIAGALAAGFLIVPAIGLEGAVRASALLAIIAFATVEAGAAKRPRLAAAGVASVVAIAAVWMLPTWDRELMSSGAYKYAPYLLPSEREPLLRAGTLHYYREGASATVSVREVTGTLALAIDGKVDASNAGDMLTQRLLAHLPLLMHPGPERVGIVGLGSGVTLASALRHPIAQADVVEISPEVVEASSFFRRENGEALADARARLIVGDGRTHLVLGGASYDVLISEPSNPWMAGIAPLFTREFFDAARARLRPGGLFCQWAHTYDMSAADLRSIVATFTDVFPESSLWLVGDADVLLVGGTTAVPALLEQMTRSWERPGVKDDLASVGVSSPPVLLSLFVASAGDLQAYAAGAPVHRDDTLALEFSGPRHLLRRTDDTVNELRAVAARSEAPRLVVDARARSDALASRGAMLFGAEAYALAFDAYARAIDHAPLEIDDIDKLLRSAAFAHKDDEAEAILRGRRAVRPDDLAAAIGLSRALASRGRFEDAAAVFAQAPEPWRGDRRVLEQLASVFADAGNPELLTSVLTELQRIAPADPATRYYQAVRELAEGRLDEAERLAKEALDRPALAGRVFTLLGAVYGTAGRRDEALVAFQAAVAADPRDPTAHENLGMLALERGDLAHATDAFAQALLLNPSSEVARRGLARASAKQ